MAIKVQYNPSTGLASYNDVTGKAQSVDGGVPGGTCTYCGDYTPKFLRVTFEDIVSLSGCYANSGGFRDSKFIGVPDLNGTYILEQSDTSDCMWTLLLDIDMTWERYESTNGTCSTFDSLKKYINARIVVIRYTGHAVISIHEGAGLGAWNFFRHIDNTPTNCVECEDVPNIDGTPIGDWPSHSGTATVEEL